jgi:hypothetical protein
MQRVGNERDRRIPARPATSAMPFSCVGAAGFRTGGRLPATMNPGPQHPVRSRDRSVHHGNAEPDHKIRGKGTVLPEVSADDCDLAGRDPVFNLRGLLADGHDVFKVT